MLQAILVSPNRIELRDVPIPEPSDKEVLIRTRSSLTCGTDLKAFLRGHQLIPMPGPFGHEFSGTVAKTGSRVKGFREGDDVMGVHTGPCLSCVFCGRGFYNLCERIMDTKVLGAYAEYMLLPEDIVKQNLYPKPDSITFPEAAMLEPLSCVIHPYKKVDLRDVEKALIIGAGPIGLMHLEVLIAEGINVMVADINRERLELAKEMGAYRVTTSDNLTDLIERETSDIGVDLIVECTGQTNVWEETVNLVRRGGVVILFGGCKSGTYVRFSTHRLHYDEITVMGSFHFTPEDVGKAYSLLTEGRVDLGPLVTAEYPLREIQEVFALLREGKGIKYALKP